MGCQASVLVRPGKTGLVESVSGNSVNLSNAIFDPRLPLTVRQKFSIIKSWKGIARNMEHTGINMFLRLFETNDELKHFFKSLQQIKDISELRENKFLEHHVTMVMYTLDEAISTLDDVDYVIDMLHTIGQSHRKMEHFVPDFFWKIEEPFLLAIKETLGDRFTANIEHIYRKTIHFILEKIVEGCKTAPSV